MKANPSSFRPGLNLLGALMAGFLLLAGLTVGFFIWDDYRNTDQAARQLLQSQARGVGDDVERRLQAIDRALSDLRTIAPHHATSISDQQHFQQHLQQVSNAMEGVRTLIVFDAAGTIVASNHDGVSGRNFADRAYFQAARRESNPAALHLSPPFKTVLGVYSMIAIKSIIGPDGQFAGAVAAVLEPEDFRSLLEGVSLYKDTGVGIIHGGGKVFVFSPASASASGADSAQLGTFFTSHQESGRAISVLTGWNKILNSERVVAIRTIRPDGLLMRDTLMVSVSRDLSWVFARWREQSGLLAGIYVLLVGISVLGLLAYQRRQRRYEHEAQVQTAWREATQSAMHQTLAMLNATGRVAQVGGWSLELASNELTWTDEVYRIHELPPGTPINVNTAIAHYAPESMPSISAAVQAAIDTGSEYDLELELITATGKRIWVRSLGKCELDPETKKTLRVYGAFQDITTARLAQRETRRALALMQSFIDHVPGLAYIKDSESRMVMANRAFEVLGLDPADMIGKTGQELLPGSMADKISRDDARVLASGKSEVAPDEYGGRYYESRRFVIDDETGQRLLGGMTMDVTRRQRSTQRVEALLAINAMGGALKEKDFLTQGLELAERLTSSKIAFLHLLNDDQETIELVTRTNNALKGCTAAHNTHYPISQAGIWADCFRQKKPVIFNDYAGWRAKKGLPAGHAPLLRLVSVPVMEEGQVRLMLGIGNKAIDYDDFDVETVQLIGNDLWRIVRRMRVEALLRQRLVDLSALNQKLAQAQGQLLQFEKLAAIGQLAAGVAHEINNPIGFVRSNLGTLGEYMEDLLTIDRVYSELDDQLAALGPQVFARVDALKKACDHAFIVTDSKQLLRESGEGLDRVTRIVQDLKGFARVGEAGWLWADLLVGLESTLNIVRNEIKYKAEVVRELVALPQVRCIPSQINQVFMNLLVNAAQAIASHGQITLRCGCDAHWVWIEVQDDGCGIAPENVSRLFEPFYTSKPVGQGTGLGLSLAWGIVQRHQGTLEVRSEPGKGSTFRVRLPIAGPSVVAESPAPP